MGVLRAKVDGVWVDVGYEKSVLDARLAALDITSNRGGVVAVGSVVSNPVTVSAASNPGTVLANLTFAPQLGRRYKVNFIMRAYQSNSASSTSGLIYLCDSGSPSSYFLGSNDLHTQYYTSLGYDNVDTSWLIDGDGVSHNFQVRMTRGVSDITAYPTQFYIEDVTASDVLQGPVTPVTQWNSSLGVVGYVESSAGVLATTSVNSTAVDSGLSVTFPTTSGRRYRVRTEGWLAYSGTADTGRLLIRDPSNNTLNQSGNAVTLATSEHASCEYDFIGDGSTKTFKTSILRVSGNGALSLSSGSGFPHFIIAEDVGPVVGVGPLTVNSPLVGWTAMPLENTWVNYSSTNGAADWRQAQYRVVGDEVQLRGLIKSGTASGGISNIWNIPSNLRPGSAGPFELYSAWAAKGAVAAATRLDIQGQYLLLSGSGTTGVTAANCPLDFLSLAGIKWSLSN